MNLAPDSTRGTPPAAAGEAAASTRLLAALCLLQVPIACIWRYNRLPAEHPFTALFLQVALVSAAAGVGLAVYAGRRPRRAARLFYPLLTLLFLANVALPSGLLIGGRHALGPPYMAHDGLVQTEDALDLLSRHTNPYGANYLELEYGKMNVGDGYKAAKHLPYWPGLLAAAMPARCLALATLGWFDMRFVYWVAFLLMGWLAAGWASHPERRRLVVLAAFFNPAFNIFFIEGRNDVYWLCFFFLGLEALRRGRLGWAAAAFGWTLGSKLTALYLLPLVGVHAWKGRSNAEIRRCIAIGTAVLLALIGPFLIWDAQAFFDDSFGWSLGFVKTAFPYTGATVQCFLVKSGLVSQVPPGLALAVQLLVAVPLFLVLAACQLRRNDVGHLLLHSALFSAVLFVLGRFFVDNHIAYHVSLLLLSYGLSFPREGA